MSLDDPHRRIEMSKRIVKVVVPQEIDLNKLGQLRMIRFLSCRSHELLFTIPIKEIERHQQTKQIQIGSLQVRDTAHRVLYLTYSLPLNCGGWAHRSINTANEDLVTFFVYPAHAGHDYTTIDATGFRKRVLEFNGVATIIDDHTP